MTEVEEQSNVEPGRARRGHLGYISKLYNDLKPLLLSSENHHAVKELKASIESQFQKYIKVHCEFVELLTGEQLQTVIANHAKHVQEFEENCHSIDVYLKEVAEQSHVNNCNQETQDTALASEKANSFCSQSVQSRTSSHSTKKLTESKVKRELARLKLKQLKKAQQIIRQKQELEQQAEVLSAEHDLEQLDLETKLWEEVVVDEMIGDKNDEMTRFQKEVASNTNENPTLTSNIVEASKTSTNCHPSVSNFNRNVSDCQSVSQCKFETKDERLLMNPEAVSFTPTQVSQPLHYVSPLHPSNIYQYPTQVPSMQPNIPTAGRGGYIPLQAGLRPNFIMSPSDSVTQAVVDIPLPKPELLVFNGDVKKYRGFITNFMTNLGSKIQDPMQKLTYLIQYCTGEAKDLIENCVLLPPADGFQRALELLKEHYGQNHTVARSYIDTLTQGPPIKPNDIDGLTKLSREAVNCQIVLSQLNYVSDLNASETLRCIVKRLPNFIQAKWVEQAAGIIQQGREPNFKDLCHFIEAKARVANTMFGREYAKEVKLKVSSYKPRAEQTKTRVSTLSTQVEVKRNYQEPFRLHSDRSSGAVLKFYCPMCNAASHAIKDCHKFKELPVHERVKVVQNAKLCFSCFDSKHFSKNCKMTCKICNRRHNVLLHDNSRLADAEQNQERHARHKGTAESEEKGVVVATTSIAKTGKVCLGVLPVVIQGPGAYVETFALLDSGSNTTLLKYEILEKLKLQGTPTTYSVQTLSNKSQITKQFQVDVSVSDITCHSNKVHVQALTVDSLPVSLDSLPSKTDLSNWNHLKDIDIPEADASQVGILIGTDCPEMFWSLEERRGNRQEPIARRTLLGWTIIGPLNHLSSPTQNQVNLLQVDPLQEQLNRQWEVDFKDLANDIRDEMSQDDKRALEIMQDSVKIVDGKYQVAIPWKINPETLPNNKQAAETRLKFLKKKLQDSELHEQYTKTVEKYISDGHARKLSPTEIAEEKPQWYLPHHPVFKKSNPSKCRVVFDCAAKYQGTSLNDAIYQGPNLLNNLAGVLIRFRKEPIAIVADIETMFHQCFVEKHDQDYLRFLWWTDGDMDKPPEDYAMLVHLFGATSSPSVVNFCLRKTAEDNQEKISDECRDAVFRSFYMDDLLRSAVSTEDAIQLVPELKQLLKEGGFNLTKWISSHRDVISAIPEDDRAKSLKEVNITDAALPQEQALGLQWNVEEDCFTYDIHIKEKPLTKRGILSMTSSLYDPLGFVSPVTLIPKLIQQNLCRIQLDWDDNIPEQLAEEFTRWQAALPLLCDVKIQRSFKLQMKAPSSQVELHIFSDASEFAYGAAAYLKLSNSEECNVHLVMGKSRVAPIKAMTIPRLELTAATVAAKLYQFLINEMDLSTHKVYFWTDSLTVLKYLENKSTRFKRFVSNRIQVIQELTNVSDWHYVPSKLNPADLASRGIQPHETKKLSVWLKGPAFLCETSNYEEVTNLRKEDSVAHELETRQLFAHEVQQDAMSKFMCSFSSYDKLITATAWLIRFVKYITLKTRGELTINCIGDLKVEELRVAENKIMQFIQTQEFSQEIKCLQQDKAMPTSSCLVSLCPVYENGIVKVGGRLENSAMQVTKHPIILPKHHVTDLIIKDVHEKSGHVGVNHCLSVVRRKFYILKGYSAVKHVIKSCFDCNKRHKQPNKQKMADLPQERTATDNPPFTVVGIDFFGPLTVKRGQGEVKRYGCLFTCVCTRAVHIEITHGLDSDSFLMAFNRFMARRGKPSQVWSDNGRNFVGAERELKEAVSQLNNKKVKDAFLVEAIEWHFLPPHAPHMGGVWERLVRSVKTILKALIKQKLLTDEELLSFMCEVEKVMNDRPLTTVSSDASDALPISPNHLLLMKGNSCVPMCTSNYVKRRWRIIQDLANKFYSRFIREYLPTLQNRHKWSNVQENIRVNDIVLVVDEYLPRGQWPLALVVEVKYGRDNLVRSAKVKVGNTIKSRPVTKLVLLEHHD